MNHELGEMFLLLWVAVAADCGGEEEEETEKTRRKQRERNTHKQKKKKDAQIPAEISGRRCSFFFSAVGIACLWPAVW